MGSGEMWRTGLARSQMSNDALNLFSCPATHSRGNAMGANMKREFLLAGSLLLLALGGSVQAQQSTRVATPVGQTLRVGVGDVMVQAETREPLPNVFGAPDIFGRTRPTGLVTVQFGGAQGGKAVLLRSSVAVQSNATTMSETGVLIPGQRNTFVHGTAGGGFVVGTTGPGTIYLPPRGANVTQFQQPTITIPVDWRRNPRVPMMGRTLVIQHADSTSITYRIE
jgi:hypothetical protein